jgi:hypothetical protein
MPMIISRRKDTHPGPDCAICNDLTAKLPNGNGCGANTDDGFKFPHPNCESSGRFSQGIHSAPVSPRIIEAIAEGRAPADLSVIGIARNLPMAWKDHNRRFGLRA